MKNIQKLSANDAEKSRDRAKQMLLYPDGTGVKIFDQKTAQATNTKLRGLK